MRNLIEKNKKGGLTTEIIAGVGGLVILVVVVLVIITTIFNANLLKGTTTTIVAVEQVSLNNGSDSYTTTLAAFNSHNHDYAIISIVNDTGVYPCNASNYTFNSALGTLTNKTKTVFMLVNVSYSYIQTTRYEDTAFGMGENLTAGTNNISEKLPTILLLTAVILLLGVLAFLVIKARALTITGGGGGFGAKGGGASSIENPRSSGVGGVSGGL